MSARRRFEHPFHWKLLWLVGVLSNSAQGGAGAEKAAIPEEWLTPAERSGYEATPLYADTLAFLRQAGERLPELRLETFGETAAGRPMTVAILSKERAFTPEAAAAAGKPVLLIFSGIHAGEIDGKDATLELVRDLAIGRRRELLDAATVLFVPVYNVDGHERVSPYNRPNQDGPVQGMGFRTTADGHDLNRDWMKLDTPEARAMVGLFRRWRPHLVVDVHVTNGCDHDWTLTWAVAEAPLLAAPLDAWVRAHLPAALAAVERAGYRAGPYVDLVDGGDPAKGFETLPGPPRFSTAYFPLRSRAAILVETHSHKPYAARVDATREFLAGLITEVGRGGAQLRAAVEAAEAAVGAAGRADAPASDVVLSWKNGPADRILFPVYAWTVEPSAVSGGTWVRYERGRVREVEVPWVHRVEAGVVRGRPRGYLVLPGWPSVEAPLRAQGLLVERLDAERELEVEGFRVSAPVFERASYQGRVALKAAIERAPERRRFPSGTLWIPADQPDFEVAVQLLEPEAPDSLFAWGALAGVFEQKEWLGEPELEAEAERLLATPEIRAAWERALADPAFAADARARVRWWSERTPYWDETVGRLPIYRALSVPSAAR
jgi:hypothetical protein